MNGSESFNKNAGISSYPGAPLFRSLTILSISSSLTNVRKILLTILSPIYDSGLWTVFGIEFANVGPIPVKKELLFIFHLGGDHEIKIFEYLQFDIDVFQMTIKLE